MSDNTITCVGTLGRDPELGYSPGGQAKCQFSIAVNRSWTDRQTNERKDQTSWFNVIAWGSLAENVASSIFKGTRVIVTGRLEQRSYETKTGEKRDWVEIVADAIGPDLRWATAVVERNERDTRSTAGREQSRQSTAAPAFEDEEPFS